MVGLRRSGVYTLTSCVDSRPLIKTHHDRLGRPAYTACHKFSTISLAQRKGKKEEK